MAGHLARMESVKIQNFCRKPGRKAQLGRPRPKWEDNITVDLTEIGCEGLTEDGDQW